LVLGVLGVRCEGDPRPLRSLYLYRGEEREMRGIEKKEKKRG
jgi:hypothetical protein